MRRSFPLLSGFVLVLLGCAEAPPPVPTASVSDAPTVSIADSDTAYFAGGCFWCMEGPFEELEGVASAVSGYMGGSVVNPTYRQVSRGGTGHAEAVRIVYDPAQVSYADLLTVFWHNIDPLSANGQFCDRGDQYRSAIFYRNDAEQEAAEASLQDVRARFDDPIATELVAASPFYEAEEEHQDFYRKQPSHYRTYRRNCGRDARLRDLWGDAAGH